MTGLEDGIPTLPDTTGPRASLVVARGEVPGLQASLWMGGARSLHGEPVEPAGLARSIIVDCAGEMPLACREAAASWQPCVFVDHDGPIPAMERLVAIAQAVALAARGEGTAPIDAAYMMCTHGMNRSGLMTGLILHELGMPGSEIIARISAARPGALSNLWFRQLLEGTAVQSR